MEIETIDNTNIEQDLWLCIDEELKFHVHVSKVANKASRLNP